MAQSLVLYEVDDRVSVITLNRPDKLNAINPEMKTALVAAFEQADQDSQTSVVLLRANGRSFCVGYDLGGSTSDEDRFDAIKWHARLRKSLSFELAPWDMTKPVVAEIHGHALGGGCELALICDLAVASESASFGEPEIRFDTIGPALLLTWFAGLKKGREMLYFGDTINAETALDLGMINKVVPDDILPKTAREYVKRLSKISPEALYCTKLAINRGVEAAGFRNALNAGADLAAMLYAAKTEWGTQFREFTREKGLREALIWRNSHFK
jgi:enoyl-CoA hydratase